MNFRKSPLNIFNGGFLYKDVYINTLDRIKIKKKVRKGNGRKCQEQDFADFD